jgi:hypothetical protein
METSSPRVAASAISSAVDFALNIFDLFIDPIPRQRTPALSEAAPNGAFSSPTLRTATRTGPPPPPFTVPRVWHGDRRIVGIHNGVPTVEGSRALLEMPPTERHPVWKSNRSLIDSSACLIISSPYLKLIGTLTSFSPTLSRHPSIAFKLNMRLTSIQSSIRE